MFTGCMASRARHLEADDTRKANGSTLREACQLSDRGNGARRRQVVTDHAGNGGRGRSGGDARSLPGMTARCRV